MLVDFLSGLSDETLSLALAWVAGAATTVLVQFLTMFMTRSVTKRTLKQQRELAQAQQEDNRQLAADARLFAERKQVYVDAMSVLSKMHRTVRDMPTDDADADRFDREHPDAPPRDIHVRLQVFAPEAAELFWAAYGTLRTAFTHGRVVELDRRGIRDPEARRAHMDTYENSIQLAWQYYSDFLDVVQRDSR